MVKCVVFDLDGVLVDSPKIYFRVMKGFLKKHSVKITDAEVSRLICYSLSEELALINKNYSLEISHDEFVRQTLGESLKISEKELELNSGARELLLDLKQNGFLAGLASNNSRESIDFMLKRFGVKKFFSSVVSAEDVLRGKPRPDIYLKIVEKLGVLAKECVAIEDTVIGVESVKAAGLKCIAFPNQFANGASFSKADLVIGGLSELSAKRIAGM